MKTRSLVSALEKMRDIPIRVGDLYIPAKDFIAIQIYSIAMYGIMPGPDGRGVPVGERERINVMKWLYLVMEGPPPSLPHADDRSRLAEDFTDDELADILAGSS